MNNKQSHLPFLGAGPLIGLGQVMIMAVGILLTRLFDLSFARIDFLKIPFIILGIILIILGIYFDYSAKLKSKLFQNIEQNKLITDGIYAYTRNPVYSGILLDCTGIVLFFNNLLLLFVPVFCWIYMTIFLIRTEEVWLKDLYGQEYEEYCKRVNRCIPWKPGLHTRRS